MIAARLFVALPMLLATLAATGCIDRSPICVGTAAGPISVAEASRALADGGLEVSKQDRAAECGAEDVVAVLDGNSSQGTLRCVIRRRPIYQSGINRLPDAPSGAAHLVEENAECFVDAESTSTRAERIGRVEAALAQAS